MHGPAIPRSADEITVGWMQDALAAGDKVDVPAIRNLELERIGSSVGLVGEILRCHLHYVGNDDSSPDKVIVKLPSSHARTQRLSKQLSLYRREFTFYRYLSDQSPIRSPFLFYGDLDEKTQRFVLVLEDLGDMDTVNQIDGADENHARTAIRAAARLHGCFWDNPGHPALRPLRASLNARRAIRLQTTYMTYLNPALKNFGHYFSPTMYRLAEDFGTRLPAFYRESAQSPLTLMHGDYRLDNMFFEPDDPAHIALIDWQISGLGSGLYDVVYFLAGSVPTEVRRKIEIEVLREYHEGLCEAGVKDFKFEECWQSYRRYALSMFPLLVIACGGLNSADKQRHQLLEVVLLRLLTTMEDLEAVEFLPVRPRFWKLGPPRSVLAMGLYRIKKAVRKIPNIS